MVTRQNVDEKNLETAEKGTTVQRSFLLILLLGFVLIVIGIAVIFVATVLHAENSASGGAVIFIGPFPIVIGAGPDAAWLILFSIILTVLSVMAFLVMKRKIQRGGD